MASGFPEKCRRWRESNVRVKHTLGLRRVLVLDQQRHHPKPLGTARIFVVIFMPTELRGNRQRWLPRVRSVLRPHA